MSTECNSFTVADVGEDPLSLTRPRSRRYRRIRSRLPDVFPQSFFNHLCARFQDSTRFETKPQFLNLGVHPIFWEMPPNNTLYDTFHSFLANNIISSTWRKDHEMCFCDLVLHYIQELITPIDITTDCPRNGHSLLEGLKRIFAPAITEMIDEEIYAPAYIEVLSMAEVDAQVASET